MSISTIYLQYTYPIHTNEENCNYMHKINYKYANLGVFSNMSKVIINTLYYKTLAYADCNRLQYRIK